MKKSDRKALWTSEDIARAVGGLGSGGKFEVSGVSNDSRLVEPGDLFVALRAERDGHDFLREALERGAAGCLVDRTVDAPSIEVADTSAALAALAAASRDRADLCTRVAVTGSVGKTSVTQALAAVAIQTGEPVHKPEASFNNHIGVPLTLTRMPAVTRYAIFEIGMNHAGEISPLTDLVKPEIAIVTAVGPVHTENFADGEMGVARAKAEIFEGLAPGGKAVLNRDGAWFDTLANAAEARGAQVLTFGAQASADIQLLDFSASGSSSEMRVRAEGTTRKVALAQSTRHWADNAMAVMLAARAMGIEFETIETALAAFEPVKGRGDIHHLTISGVPITLVNDSYNANPMSMTAAIRNLGGLKVKNLRIAVLTDMLELGPTARDAHEALSAVIEEAGIDLVFAAGPLMGALFEALPVEKRGFLAQTADDVLAPLLAQLSPGDTVLVKGSNGSGARRVSAALLEATD